MLFYNFNTLDSYIKDNLTTNIVVEKNNLDKIRALYDNKKTKLSDIIENMINTANFTEKGKIEKFHDANALLKKSIININNIEKFVLELIDDLKYINELCEKNIADNENEIKACLVEYNKQRENLFNKILEFENDSTCSFQSAINNFLNIDKKSVHNENNIARINIDSEQHDSNVLIISEKEQKAYLPFFYNKVKDIFENPEYNYKNMQDVVNTLYVLPLNKFKNSSLSRFRESFNLIRFKENGTILQALDLGLELLLHVEI